MEIDSGESLVKESQEIGCGFSRKRMKWEKQRMDDADEIESGRAEALTSVNQV